VTQSLSFLALVLTACVIGRPTDAGAQQRPALSLEASAGVGTGAGGEFQSRAGFAFDGFIGLRVRQANRGGTVAGLTGGIQGALASGDDCLLTPSGGCVPDFPLFYSAAALLGWEAAGTRGPSLRMLAGPAYYRADEGGAALGLQARLDVATPALLHVALVASVRGAVLPNFRSDALRLAAAGLGVRLQ
jgi:hypothetical protein